MPAASRSVAVQLLSSEDRRAMFKVKGPEPRVEEAALMAYREKAEALGNTTPEEQVAALTAMTPDERRGMLAGLFANGMLGRLLAIMPFHDRLFTLSLLSAESRAEALALMTPAEAQNGILATIS
jgi:hypothetical protein